MISKLKKQKVEGCGRWIVHDEEELGVYWAESNLDAIAQYKNDARWSGVKIDNPCNIDAVMAGDINRGI